MSHPYIVAVCMINYRIIGFGVTAVNYVYESLDEAIGAGVRAAMKNYPPSEGWTVYKTDVKELSRETLEYLLACARPWQEIPEELK